MNRSPTPRPRSSQCEPTADHVPSGREAQSDSCLPISEQRIRQWAANGLQEVDSTGPAFHQAMEQLRARFPETGPAQRDGNGRAAGRNQEAAGIPPADAPSGSVGDYVLLEQLGRGGMRVVYRARDVRLQRDVAIKVLRDDRNDQQSRQRVLREAQAAARIDHANVVRVFAAACDERGSPYLVMQFIAGPSLAAQLTEQGSLAPRDAARIAAQAAHGLSAAHQQGLIHRDVKPSNILLDTDGTAKVSDFGLVWQAASATRFTSTGTLPGTPEYMSPEQVQAAGPVDARSDVYSLGVTLYELLTGELPFRGTPAMVLRQIVAEEPRRPRSLNDHVPRDLETIVLKAMEKNPASRYPSAKEMALDLDRWQRGEPIEARPIGPGGRLLRLCRRRPVASLLSAMLIAVTVLGFAGILWQWQRAEAQRAVAQRQRQAAQQQRARAAQEGARAEQQRQLAEQLQHRAERTLRAMRKEQQLKEAMQQEAEQQRYLANQARGQLVESVFQQQLTQDPTMEGAQRKFSEALQQAMAEFARRQRTNPQDRQRAAAALAAMAAMARRQQQVDRSIALYEKARTMFHALASQPGAGNETQQAVIWERCIHKQC